MQLSQNEVMKMYGWMVFNGHQVSRHWDLAFVKLSEILKAYGLSNQGFDAGHAFGFTCSSNKMRLNVKKTKHLTSAKTRSFFWFTMSRFSRCNL